MSQPSSMSFLPADPGDPADAADAAAPAVVPAPATAGRRAARPTPARSRGEVRPSAGTRTGRWGRVSGVLLLALLPLAARAQLSGSYTIGGASPDFGSFGAATAALASQGVAGPVDFLVRAGTYVESGGTAPVIALTSNVSGASATNRITFRPDAASGATVDDVVLERSDASGGTGAYLINLRADWVTLRELTLRAGNPTTTAFLHGAFVSIYASNGERRGVEIEGCVLESRSQASGGVIQLGGNTGTLRDVRIVGNRFHDLVLGVHADGFATGYTNLTIEGNRFTGMRDRNTAQGDAIGTAIKVALAGGPLVIRDNVLDYAGGAGASGISVIAHASPLTIDGNQIRNVFSGAAALFGGFSGIQQTRNTSTGSITNNMVSVQTARRTGLYVSAPLLVAHNTVYLPERGIDFFGGSQALHVCGSNLEVVGNILVDLGTGTNNRTNAIFQTCGGSNNTFDGNLLYNKQGALAYTDAGVAVANLAAWQAAGNGASSVSKLPEVVDVFADLHLAGCTAGDPALYGLPLAQVPDDIDDRVRDSTGPMMGAHESRAAFPALFGEPALYAPFAGSTGTPLYLDAADLDGDDDVDLVVSLTGSWHGLGLLENLGDGTFAPMTPIDMNTAGAGGGQGPLVVKAADIDGDGPVDLAVARELSTFFEVHWGTGGGAFAAPTAHDVNNPFPAPPRHGISDFELADVDGNGLLDLVFSDTGIPSVAGEEGDLGVLCNQTGRSFVDLAGTGALPGPPNPYDLVVADLDGDLDPDLLVNSAGGTTLTDFGVLGNGGGSCADLLVYKSYSHDAVIDSAPLLPDLVVADFDGDGLADLAADDGSGPAIGAQQLPLFFHLGNLDFDPAVDTPVDDSPKRSPGALVALDYEGDGAPDLLVGNETQTVNGPGELVLLRNDGTGVLTPTLACGPSTLPREPRQLVSADFDDDGRPDFAAIMEGATEVAVVLQPVPEPAWTAALALATAALGAAGRRRPRRGPCPRPTPGRERLA